MTDSPTPQPKLTPKQQLFVDAYVGESHFNASAAALAAGYRHRTEGPHLLSNPIIRARIDQVLSLRAASRDEVLDMLREDARRLDDDIVTRALGADSPAIGAAIVSSLISARSSAKQHLAKAHGLFTDKLHITGDMVVRQYVGMDPDDFDAPDDDGGGV